MVIQAGVLSDTHCHRPDNPFKKQIKQCFAGCDVIIHAGDITNQSVLELFAGKPVYAVSGNMCDTTIRHRYPKRRVFTLNGHILGLTHGDRLGLETEHALLQIFPEAACIISGHTHRPFCQRLGEVLFLNPGSFKGTGPYGAPGTYAILEIGDTLHASLHTIASPT
ncbi:metallophosphoesterase family protein [Desulfobulbus alkaliphilus]|uniref:metallophosphoesterase family protein n=1 Tax=Desulfobulbus alkaliphilus TaxID=869814 RepID=UPI001963E8C6|nr:metallophosphoesterase family protein [Desulfobulbus alkaliphilus]MBM9537244.1 metallophosphoesterase family protein [Desulfobulbus alkaliphilus]